MLIWLLNLVYTGLIVALAPVLAFRALFQGKYRAGWRQKLWGAQPRREGDGPCLWLHAVSVGEVMQLKPLIARLREQQPALDVVISVTTTTGFDVARDRYPDCRVIYYPLDFSWAVEQALDRIRPTAIALVELELWPNFLFAAARRRIPVLLVNGRISERSFRGYRRIRFLMEPVLACLRRLAVQNSLYASRLVELGADPRRILVTGSIKFDGVETHRAHPATARLRQLFRLQANQPVFVAGSTQDPEERYALDAWLACRERFPELRLILVPRHKERFDEVARIVEHNYRLPLVRRSRLDAADAFAPPPFASESVLLLDTLGELSACWGLADIAFVGGSLTRRGGQNMIEPAGYGAATLFGPNTWNFKDAVDLLLESDAALVVQSGRELTDTVVTLLSEPARRQAMGQRAKKLVTSQSGAAARTAQLLLSALADAMPGPQFVRSDRSQTDGNPPHAVAGRSLQPNT